MALINFIKGHISVYKTYAYLKFILIPLFHQMMRVCKSVVAPLEMTNRQIKSLGVFCNTYKSSLIKKSSVAFLTEYVLF